MQPEERTPIGRRAVLAGGLIGGMAGLIAPTRRANGASQTAPPFEVRDLLSLLQNGPSSGYFAEATMRGRAALTLNQAGARGLSQVCRDSGACYPELGDALMTAPAGTITLADAQYVYAGIPYGDLMAPFVYGLVVSDLSVPPGPPPSAEEIVAASSWLSARRSSSRGVPKLSAEFGEGVEAKRNSMTRLSDEDIGAFTSHALFASLRVAHQLSNAPHADRNISALFELVYGGVQAIAIPDHMPGAQAAPLLAALLSRGYLMVGSSRSFQPKFVAPGPIQAPPIRLTEMKNAQ